MHVHLLLILYRATFILMPRLVPVPAQQLLFMLQGEGALRLVGCSLWILSVS